MKWPGPCWVSSVEMLDLVAIGELADLVSLAGENHALVALGCSSSARSRPGFCTPC